eukprot:TRINITY_DN275_c0_g1_i8.p1 TRINITY_DN275_c0_g1~~TRINITY_DN275_c0_g1_i8.p1  ORF type:complete len:418 (-),score=96.44 TRINITY_DN275_c0_g1_i8:952-2205(-)
MERSLSEVDKKAQSIMEAVRQNPGSSELKKEGHERSLFAESSEQSFELNDEDMIEFFNRVEASRESMGSMQLQLEELKGNPGLNRISSQQCLDDEPINANAECILVGGDDSTEDTVKKTAERKRTEPARSEWSNKFPWDQEVIQANKIFFNNKRFKPNQLEIINAAKSRRDVLGVIGSGLSLVFQIAAITEEGVTFVVMPSLNLATAQTNSLTLLSIGVALLANAEDIKKAKVDLAQDKSLIKIAYVVPELFSQVPMFMGLLEELNRKRRVARFAVYDAGCISKYGAKFKADYLMLELLRKKFPAIPILALSFAASTAVQQDICKSLLLKQPVIIRGLSISSNTFLEVRKKVPTEELASDMAAFIKASHPNDSGIIYCASVKESEQISKLLETKHKLSCVSYNEGMSECDKKAVQEQ